MGKCGKNGKNGGLGVFLFWFGWVVVFFWVWSLVGLVCSWVL